MNRRLCVWVVSILTGYGSLAMGQAAPAPAVPPTAAPTAPLPTLPPGVQTNVLESPADNLAIKTFVKSQLTGLTGTDPAARTAARRAIAAQLTRGSSQDFYKQFSNVWVDAATAVLDKSPSVAVRLNIAIITSTLTDVGGSLDCEPLVVKLLGDKQPCVTLWGIHASRPLLMSMMVIPGGSAGPTVLSRPLVGALVDAVKNDDNRKSDVAGMIATDAYTALVFDNAHTITGMTPQQQNPFVLPLVAPLLDILESRLEDYRKGIAGPGGKLMAPQSPGAEHGIGTFLSINHGSVPPALQKRIVQDLVTLITYLGDRAALYQNNKEDLAQLRETVKYVASPIKVLVPSQAVGTGLTWLLSPPSSFTVKELQDHTKLVYALIQGDADFKWLVKPADVVPIEPPQAAKAPAAPVIPGAAPSAPAASGAPAP